MDFNISFVLGLYFALSAAPALKQEKSIFNRYFRRAFLFQLLVFVPMGIYLVTTWPDWSWMYTIDTSAHPNQVWLGPLLASVGYMVMMLIGYITGHVLVRINEESSARLLMVMGLIGLALAGFLPFYPRPGVMWLGTTEQFRAGIAPLAIKDTKWVVSFIIIGIYFFIPFAWIVIKNKKESQGLPA